IRAILGGSIKNILRFRCSRQSGIAPEVFNALKKAMERGFEDLEWLRTEKSIKKIRKDKQFKEVLVALTNEPG
ncbi:MAG: hypothetical protein AAF206_03630, partial [Bacteroidota bacterium]